MRRSFTQTDPVDDPRYDQMTKEAGTTPVGPARIPVSLLPGCGALWIPRRQEKGQASERGPQTDDSVEVPLLPHAQTLASF